MTDSNNKANLPVASTLSESDIVTKRTGTGNMGAGNMGRRGFMGLVALGTAGVAGATLGATPAAAADSDGAGWSDRADCPRGSGSGVSDTDTVNADAGGYGRTGITDQDAGSNSDMAGRGRGAPYC